jgi:glycosyltransferase involved in cell wall biosynthesis
MIPSWYRSPQFPLNGVFFREQAHALKDAGCRMGVVVPGQYSVLVMRQYGRWRYREAFENDDGIPTYSSYTCAWFPLVPYANTHFWLKHGMRLFERYLREVGRPDLIQAQAAFQAGILAERIKRRYGIPYVLSEHSSMFLEGRVSFWQMPLVRRAWAEADARTVVSPKLGEATERYFGAVAGGWTWLPNMVERQFFEMPLRPARGRSREFRFLHVAHFTSTKNQPDLIRAFAGRFRGEAGVVLRIGGDGASRPALEGLAARLGVRNQVRFLGMLSRDRVLQEMLAADAFVLSSHFETFSIVLAEALACGTPVVSTACGGPECIVNETNGLLVPPGDVRALGQAMAAVRERAGRYDAEAIRRDCARRFSQEAVVAKWTQIYETVLARSGAAGRRAG